MARASSVISVAITGDSKKLQGALKGADKGVAGFGKSMKSAALGIGTALAGVFAVSKAFDFVQGALGEADRLGDSVGNLQRIIGKVNTAKLQKTANAFLDLGLSSADVLELSVGFARIARSIGLKPNLIANYADDVVSVAKAFALTDEKGRDAAQWVEIIAKAAAKPKAVKPLAALGISVNEAQVIRDALKKSGKQLPKDLTDAEKNAARLLIILKKISPEVAKALANPDVELKQEQLRAKIEELQGQLGTGLQPIVADILQNVLDISKSEWVDDMVKGIEVLQGKHDVPIFEDLKKGIEVAQATFNIANEEWSSDIDELQDAFTVQLPAGIAVAWDALQPIVGTLGDIGNATIDIENAVAGAFGSMIDWAKKALSPLGTVLDILGQITDALTHLDSSPRFSVSPGRTPRGSPGSGTTSDRFVSDAVRRQRERNGLGR